MEFTLRFPRSIVVCVCVLSQSAEVLADTVPISDALAVITQSETATSIVEYTCDFATGQFATADDLADFHVRFPARTTSRVRWDFERNRFFAQLESVQDAVTPGDIDKGKKSFFSSHREFANDSEVFQTWFRGISGPEPPPIPTSDTEIHQANRSGIVSTANEEQIRAQGGGLIATRCIDIGLGWISPYVWSQYERPQKFSEYILAKMDGGDEVAIKNQANGLWRVDFSIRKTHEFPYEWSLLYDAASGRPVEAEWGYGASDNPAIWNATARVLYEYNDERDVCPSRVVLVDLPLGGRCYEWKYREVHVNPKLTDADFRLVFPKGVEVTDYVNESVYIVGKSSADDDKAAAQFMELQGLKPAAPPIRQRTGWFGIVLALNCAALVVVLAAVAWRRKRRSTQLVIAACIVLSSQAVAREPDRVSPASFGMDAETNGAVHKTQCGFLASVFVFRNFHVDRICFYDGWQAAGSRLSVWQYRSRASVGVAFYAVNPFWGRMDRSLDAATSFCHSIVA